MYKLNYLNFEERNNNYLITNEAGKYMFISKDNFNSLMKKEDLDDSIKKELEEKGFIYKMSDEIFSNDFSTDVRKMKNYLLTSTSLHIFVVSKKCNFRCVYCQAGYLNEKDDLIMSKEIAKKSVDIALQSPSDFLTFEFQGGEPLTNFEIIRYIIDYSKSINTDKTIDYSVVSNLTLLTDEMLDYFLKNNVKICTSIDGNKSLQNKNRPLPNGDSYEETIKEYKKIKELGIKVNAIETTSRYTLDKYKELIDEYIDLRLDSIFLRPLTQLGKADNNWKSIGYKAEEFLEFYKNAFEYIVEKNKSGYLLIEGLASIFLKKILLNESINYMELRSPCGGTIGQLAYYYNGDIFSCDEARMLSEMGDDSFKLGNVFDNNYEDLMKSDVTNALAVASCLECLPTCHSCVYMPYCGTCPVINLSQDNSIFVHNPNEFRCKVYKGVLNLLFEYIENVPEVVEIFKKWIE